MTVSLKRAGVGVEPPRSQLLLSKHTQRSQEQHVSQPGKKGQVKEPLDGQNEPYRQRGKGTVCVYVCVCVRESQNTAKKVRKRAKKKNRERVPAFVSCQPDKRSAKEFWCHVDGGGVTEGLIILWSFSRQKVGLCVLLKTYFEGWIYTIFLKNTDNFNPQTACTWLVFLTFHSHQSYSESEGRDAILKLIFIHFKCT